MAGGKEGLPSFEGYRDLGRELLIMYPSHTARN